MTGKEIVVCCAVVAVVGAIARYDGTVAGGKSARAKIASQRVDTMSRAQAKAETVYAKAKPIFATAKTVYDTARIHDTVPVTIERPGKPDTVKIYIPRSTCDSVVAAADSLVRSCSFLHDRDTLLIRALRQQVTAEHALRPGPLRPWADRLYGALAGAGACLIFKR